MALGKSQPDGRKVNDPQSIATTTTTTKSVKPSVLRIQTANQRVSDLEDYDEDELLADSPTTPPANPVPFANRRVVLTSSSDAAATANKPKVLLTKNATAKGIFDRLDSKIGINEAAKRKIQKIVIKSND